MTKEQWQMEVDVLRAVMRDCNAAGARHSVKGEEAQAKIAYAAASRANTELIKLRTGNRDSPQEQLALPVCMRYDDNVASKEPTVRRRS